MRLRTVHHAPSVSKINVTPLIDVVMVLIVFYLIVGKLASDRATAVQLPGSGVGTAADAAGIVISVVAPSGGTDGAKAEVLLDGVAMPASGLADALKARLTPDASGLVRTPVQVRADRRLPYSAVLPVVEACRKAGVTSLKLVTQREGAGAGGKP